MGTGPSYQTPWVGLGMDASTVTVRTPSLPGPPAQCGRTPSAPRPSEQLAHERRADDHAVGERGDLGRLLAVGDAEADADRQVGAAARVRATSASAASPTVARVPVTPIVEAA